MSDPIAAIKSLAIPDQASMTRSAEATKAMAMQCSISTDEDYGLAGEELQVIKRKQKDLEDRRTSITKPMNDALRAVNALFKPAAELLSQAEAAIKSAMISYSDRKEAEAAAARAEAERIAREQAAAQAANDDADAAMDAAIEAVAAAPVVAAAPKAAGISKVRVLKRAVVSDKAAFVRAALEQPMLMELIEVDAGKLNKLAGALGNSFNVPGIEIVDEKSISARAA